MAQLAPELLPIEVGEREQKIGHGALLLAEEADEVVRELACGGHARSVSCEFRLSPSAPGKREAR